MFTFTSLIKEIKLNGESIDFSMPSGLNNPIDFLFTENPLQNIVHLIAHSHYYIQIILKANNNDKLFCRQNVIEYFDNNNKIAEFLILSSQLDSLHLKDEMGCEVEIILLGANIQCDIHKEFEYKKFRLKTLSYPGLHEKIWNSHRDIRYYYIPAKESSLDKQLIIVFAGMGKKFEYRYNYSKALADIHCHKLFIIDDYGDRGSYYLGNNNDSLVESSIVALVLHYANSKQIPLSNIMTMGSSKGGYAALYYGIKYSFGKIVAAAPQTLLGDYLKNFTLDMVEDMTGNRSKADIAFLNKKLFQLIEGNRTYPDIHLIVGDKDAHLTDHLMPLTNLLKQKNVEFNYEIISGYGHQALALFQNYITQKAHFLILNKNATMYVKAIELNRIGNRLLCEVKSDHGENLDFAYYWYQDRQCIDKQFYIKGRIYSQQRIKNPQSIYDVIVFVKLNNSIIRLISEKIVISSSTSKEHAFSKLSNKENIRMTGIIMKIFFSNKIRSFHKIKTKNKTRFSKWVFYFNKLFNI